jgi:hypothetical protein
MSERRLELKPEVTPNGLTPRNIAPRLRDQSGLTTSAPTVAAGIPAKFKNSLAESFFGGCRVVKAPAAGRAMSVERAQPNVAH